MKHSFLAAIIVFIFLAGCATKKIDWASRINHYTFDQTVIELGPPDKSAKLSDGSTIAEWHSYPGGPSFGFGTGISAGPVGVGVGIPIGDSSPRVTRLTFGPDGTLKSATH